MALTDKVKNYLKAHYLSPSMVLALDEIISVIASLCAVLLVRLVSDPFGNLTHFLGVWVLLSAVASLVGFLVSGTNKVIIRHSSYKSIGKIMSATLIKEVLLAVCVAVDSIKNYSINIEWFVLLMDALLTFFFLLVLRVAVIVIFDLVHSSMKEDVHRVGVLIYGVGDNSVSMASRLALSDTYRVEGFLTSRTEYKDSVIASKPIFVYTKPEDLGEIIDKLDFSCVLFTADDPEDKKANLINFCLEKGLHIVSAPAIENVNFEEVSQGIAAEEAAKEDFIPDGMSNFERVVKRFVDCVLSGIALIIFLPLFLICFIAVKLEDGGPAIFKQERIGRFGRPFNIYKFRSMRVDAEAQGPALAGSGGQDSRLTKVGKFLREHHLDELPQLWNVFKGDMAFIGPRPERKFYIDQIIKHDPRYTYLYQIRPGVTSYATLRNGYTDTMEKMLTRLEYDLYYLKHRSWWFDFKILFMTFMSIVFGKKF